MDNLDAGYWMALDGYLLTATNMDRGGLSPSGKVFKVQPEGAGSWKVTVLDLGYECQDMETAKEAVVQLAQRDSNWKLGGAMTWHEQADLRPFLAGLFPVR